LPSITRLSQRVSRILGQNPGKFTLQGTNTYLVGARRPFVLIDTGEGRPEYIPLLKEALRESPGEEGSRFVSDIIISHRHRDHFGGLPSVLALLKALWDESGVGSPYLPPRIHQFPLPPSKPDELLVETLRTLPNDSFQRSSSASIVHDLNDEQIIPANDASLVVIHTPGHTTDSISLYLPEERTIFTADTVLGQGTAVFEDLTAYMASLGKLRNLGSSPSTPFSRLLPGHGPVVNDGIAHIQTYMQHRLDREHQIIAVLSSPPPAGENWTIENIVANIYSEYPQNLWAAASGSVLLHLRKLEAERRAKKMESGNNAWVLIQGNR